MLYACDHTWWSSHFAQVAQIFRGELWTVSESAAEFFDLQYIYGCEGGGLSPATDRIHTGKNSGYQAIGLAQNFGAARIVLLGFDFQVGPAGEVHWHGLHPKGLSNSGPGRFGDWARLMTRLAEDLEKAGVKVVNASRATALRCFRRVPLPLALHDT